MGAVQGLEDAPVEVQEGVEAAALAQKLEQGGEEAVEGGGAEAIEQVVGNVIRRDTVHAEQRAAIGVEPAMLHVLLEVEEGMVLEEEYGEDAEGGVGHGKGCWVRCGQKGVVLRRAERRQSGAGG